MLYNIHTQEWDSELLALFDIPENILPEVKASSEVYGHTVTTIFASRVPIAGIAGDQQAALFGQMCTEPGMVKNTYGTGCFILMNTGSQPVVSKNNLVSTIAWRLNGVTSYALEGSIFVAGAIVQWLRDGLKIIRSSSEIEQLAKQVDDNGGVYFVPALTGLGAPYWDQYARGTIVGLSRGTTDAHIARAALEGIAYQTMDVVNAMILDAGIGLKELRVDGGASRNNLLMQFQADVLGEKVIRPQTVETTALGAAYMAGLAVGFWADVNEIRRQWHVEATFEPNATFDAHLSKRKWADAIYRSQSWIKS
jgi:glycerol kinase